MQLFMHKVQAELAVFQVGLQYSATFHLTTEWAKKVSNCSLHITSSNTGRFSKFLHRHILQKICNKAIIKYPTSPQTRRYTTLWNIYVVFNYRFICKFLGECDSEIILKIGQYLMKLCVDSGGLHFWHTLLVYTRCSFISVSLAVVCSICIIFSFICNFLLLACLVCYVPNVARDEVYEISVRRSIYWGPTDRRPHIWKNSNSWRLP